jgi:dTDP-4-amino-4,6-dideoxygalactose transaminase
MQFIDLHAQQARLKDKIDAGLANVLAHGQYILGPEVAEFESALAAFAEAKFALGCGNGTDALLMPLLAWGIGRGDAVFCPSFSYCATAEVIALAKATPIFVDIDRDTYNMDPESLRQAIAGVLADGTLTPKAIIAVDLFGQCANYDALAPIAREAGLKLMSDSAQGFGSTLNGHHPLHWVDAQTTSFFPAKPLGCYGDGGAVLTNDADLHDVLLSLRFHGRGQDYSDTARIGLNSRLDTMQAAILLAKLSVFADEIDRRNKIADRYADGLGNQKIGLPVIMDGVRSTWAQYTIEVDDPTSFCAAMKAADIPTARYYPRPIHQHTAYANFPIGQGGLTATEASRDRVVSLPMHAYLEPADQARIIEAAIKAAA